MMKIYTQLFTTTLIFLLAGISCKTKDKKPAEAKESADHKFAMIETDRAFSKLSQQEGIRTAMMEYIDAKGVLLRPGTMPMVGGEAINYISQASDTSYTMTWEPEGGTISASGDLGYTFGVYSLKPKATDTVFYGTYVSIWKKQPDGKWKFVLETGNEGVEQ